MVTLTLAVALLAGAPDPQLCSGTPIHGFSVVNGEFGWHGLQRGMSVSQVESLFAVKLHIEAPRKVLLEMEGSYWAKLRVANQDLSIGFTGEVPESIVVGFFIRFEGTVRDCECMELASAIRRQVPTIRHDSWRGIGECEYGAASYVVPGNTTTGLLIKETEGVYWVPRGWIE